MTQNEPGVIAALTAQTHQILGEALRQNEFAAVAVMERLPTSMALPERPHMVREFFLSGAAASPNSSGISLRDCRA